MKLLKTIKGILLVGALTLTTNNVFAQKGVIGKEVVEGSTKIAKAIFPDLFSKAATHIKFAKASEAEIFLMQTADALNSMARAANLPKPKNSSDIFKTVSQFSKLSKVRGDKSSGGRILRIRGYLNKGLDKLSSKEADDLSKNLSYLTVKFSDSVEVESSCMNKEYAKVIKRFVRGMPHLSTKALGKKGIPTEPAALARFLKAAEAEIIVKNPKLKKQAAFLRKGLGKVDLDGTSLADQKQLSVYVNKLINGTHEEQRLALLVAKLSHIKNPDSFALLSKDIVNNEWRIMSRIEMDGLSNKETYVVLGDHYDDIAKRLEKDPSQEIAAARKAELEAKATDEDQLSKAKKINEDCP